METNELYTHGHHDSVLRSHRWRTAANSAAYLLGELRPGAAVLDVGCGPGTITRDLARLVAPGPTVGVDRSAEVVAEAEAGAPIAGLDFRVGDAYALPFPDDSFDVVHAHQVLQHLADPVAALREWHRVLRPGGIVAARDGDYASFVWHPADPRLDHWLALYRALARANSGEPDAGRRLVGWVHEAGFVDVRPTASAWMFATPEDRAWWAGLWADRITRSAVADQLTASAMATNEELADVAEAFRSWAGHPDASFIVPHGEVIARAA
jgi:ubiquinone/menaquinone biosynthesis C-methylase UbiE